jgi:hypothetical protein
VIVVDTQDDEQGIEPTKRLLAHFPCATCGSDPGRMLELIPKRAGFIGPQLAKVDACPEGWTLFRAVCMAFGLHADFVPFAPGGCE